MIRRVEALNFRSLRYVSQRLDRFHALVGPNGAGKSNLIDAIELLRDALRLGPVKAVLGNGEVSVARASNPRQLCFMDRGSRFDLALELSLPDVVQAAIGDPTFDGVRYEVAFEIDATSNVFGLTSESLWLLPRTSPTAARRRALFPESSTPPDALVVGENRASPRGWRNIVRKTPNADYFGAENGSWKTQFRLGPTKSALANLPDDDQRFPAATWARRVLLEGVQRIALRSDVMRRPSPVGSGRRFMADGSNLPWAVQHLADSDRDRFERWVSHVRTALPELQGVRIADRAEDNAKYIVLEYRTGFSAPSWLVSDGTLRLLALTFLAYAGQTDAVYLIEEPENGLHPRVIEIVMQSLSSVYDGQVLCASHSPVVLSLLKPEQILCVAKDGEGATDVVLGSEHPRLREWQGRIDLGSVFASGILG